MANPDLAALLTEAVGKSWVTDLSQLLAIRGLTDDTGFRDRFRRAKQTAKARFAAWVKHELNISWTKLRSSTARSSAFMNTSDSC